MSEDKTVGAYEAKTHLPQLLREVDMGQEYVITVKGRRVAKLIPAGEASHDVASTIEEIKALRAGLRLDGLNLRAMIDEGRK